MTAERMLALCMPCDLIEKKSQRDAQNLGTQGIGFQKEFYTLNGGEGKCGQMCVQSKALLYREMMKDVVQTCSILFSWEALATVARSLFLNIFWHIMGGPIRVFSDAWDLNQAVFGTKNNKHVVIHNQ